MAFLHLLSTPLLLLLLLNSAVQPGWTYGAELKRACVVTVSRSGVDRRECVDITSVCSRLNCPSDRICALSHSGVPLCLPGNASRFQNCESEEVRLQQPCPADASVVGFGRGCTFCEGERPPRRPQPPTPARACVVYWSSDDVSERECVDISRQCREKRCAASEVCGMNPQKRVECYSASFKNSANCGSESFRLSQPCPPGARAVGFGMGCTFCLPDLPGPPSPNQGRGVAPLGPGPPTQPPPWSPAPLSSRRACLVVHVGNGNFKRECVDISRQCRERACPSGTVCALDNSEQVQCFPQSVKNFENCGPERFRLQQPCPADSGIRGFGMGCTFCGGGNPFVRPVPPPPDPTMAPEPPISGSEDQQRACKYIHVGRGNFQKECVDISRQCQQRSCPTGTVCGLDLRGQLQCFPGSVKDFENCGPEEFRLSQPCPADAGIRGFGMGCTFCVGGNPFVRPVPPPPDPTMAPETPRPRPEGQQRACKSIQVGEGYFHKECVDISRQCQQKSCPAETVCGLDLYGQLQCFPESVKEFQNCGPEEFRLLQPCPADAGIRGFGMGCTFCVGGNPFGPIREPLPPSPPPRQHHSIGTACVVRHIGDGNFKKECLDIRQQCEKQNCPEGTVCGLDLAERIQCFPESVKEFENCGPETFRLSQPCPADAGIRGFGMGCTFCVGGNPFEVAATPSPQPRPFVPPSPPPEPIGRACVFIYQRERRKFKKQCIDISQQCQQKQCPPGTVCGLDLEESVQCFPESVKNFENCGSESLRLSQPCPADAGIRGFGIGCTFCVGRNPFVQPTVPAPTRPVRPTGVVRGGRACVNRILQDGRERRGCRDISAVCQRLACPPGQVCALSPEERPVCFTRQQLPIENCGDERLRVSQPCPADTQLVAYGAGCTYCSPASPTTSTPPVPTPPTQRPGQRVCLASRGVCQSIEERCAQRRCPDNTECVLDWGERLVCYPLQRLTGKYCGSEQTLLASPCGPSADRKRPFAHGPGCNYCV